MLHTKAQGHWPFGSREGFLPYMGVAAILVMWPRCPEQTFILEKKIFENGERTTEHA